MLRRGKVEHLRTRRTRSRLRLLHFRAVHSGPMHFGLRLMHFGLMHFGLWARLPLHLLLLPSRVDHRAEELYRSGSAERQGPGEIVLEVYELDQITD